MILERQVQMVVAERCARGRRPVSVEGAVRVAPTRNAFLAWVYDSGLVEASTFSAHCADKLFFARLVEKVAPLSVHHPRTRALTELLPDLEHNLAVEFPVGWVVKPVSAMDSDGANVYLDAASFLADFAKEPLRFLSRGAEVSALTGLVSSGERFLVQERVGEREREYRLHTWGSRVVSGATFTRWDQAWSPEHFRRAEAALQDFLDALPNWLTDAQAWSVDMIESRGAFRLVEVNTNRGKTSHWSGDLANPDTLQAYALFFERELGLRFDGEGGDALRAGMANREHYLRKFGPEAVAKHERLKRDFASLAGPFCS